MRTFSMPLPTPGGLVIHNMAVKSVWRRLVIHNKAVKKLFFHHG